MNFIRAIRARKSNKDDEIINAYNDEMVAMCECEHDPNREDNSLVLGSKRNMVYPEEFVFLCKHCGRTFVFNRIEGKYIKVGHRAR